MLQLSRRGWNNLIIYGVLALFFLFYIAPNHLAMLRSKEQSAVQAPGQRILQIKLPRVVLQQAGPQWRATPTQTTSTNAGDSIALKDPATIVLAWQQLQLPLPQANDAMLAQLCFIELTLSDEATPQQWQLMLDNDHYLLKGPAGFYPLSKPQAEALCPEKLR